MTGRRYTMLSTGQGSFRTAMTLDVFASYLIAELGQEYEYQPSESGCDYPRVTA